MNYISKISFNFIIIKLHSKLLKIRWKKRILIFDKNNYKNAMKSKIGCEH